MDLLLDYDAPEPRRKSIQLSHQKQWVVVGVVGGDAERERERDLRKGLGVAKTE